MDTQRQQVSRLVSQVLCTLELPTSKPAAFAHSTLTDTLGWARKEHHAPLSSFNQASGHQVSVECKMQRGVWWSAPR